ncbi:MAG: GTPase HflX [Alphaproteobacteria bacterium]|nr:GTPase HflX [Alphaproteobacteria bacterium]
MLDIEQNRKFKTIVICPALIGERVFESYKTRLNEAIGLSLAINLDVVYSEVIRIKEIRPATYFSKGFVEKILPVIEKNDVFLMIVDTSLTPIQQRNLEKALHIKVIDRTALILEIFGERANTNEGKLQVELAHLTYQRSRLVRSWTHLERQRGGAGFLGGPGEKQIELDKRLIDDKIVKIKKELEKVKNTRGLQRGNRKKVPYPIVALVGYTNAGKSSLFNYLTKDNVMVADMLFATLDPVLRKIKLSSGLEVILSDTVGFISNLPHELVMAFRSTLEEVLEADLVVHVRDISCENTDVQRKDVLDVLHGLGLKNIETSNNYIEVFNKIDLLNDDEKTALQKQICRKKESIVALSALTGEGCGQLLKMADNKLTGDYQEVCFKVKNTDGKSLSLIYQYADVIEKTEDDDFICVRAKINKKALAKLQKLMNTSITIKIYKA